MVIVIMVIVIILNLCTLHLVFILNKHDRTTRNNEKFEIPLFRSATGQRTFAYRAVSLWNTLDEDLRNATTVKAFKKALKLVMNE